MEPHEAAIEAKSGQEITVIPNRTMLGIIALMEGRAHMAMISASLESEVGKLKKAMPGLDYDRLKVFEIASTRVAFVVNPANPVRKASLDQIKKVLTGEITNWSALGGKDAPIRLVIVGGGGGVVTTVESELLDGQPVHSPNIIYVKTALQLIGIVEQEPNALGIAQLSLARQKGLPEIVTERPVEQTLEPDHAGRADAGHEIGHRRGARRRSTRPCECRWTGGQPHTRAFVSRIRRRASSAPASRRSFIASPSWRCWRWRRCRSRRSIFPATTENAARHLYGDSFLGVLSSTRLELLLANHRRIVESMPPEVDRDRLQADRNELDQIKQPAVGADRGNPVEAADRSRARWKTASPKPAAAVRRRRSGRVLCQRIRAGQGGRAGQRLRPHRQRHRAPDQELSRPAAQGGAGGHRLRQRDGDVACGVGAAVARSRRSC